MKEHPTMLMKTKDRAEREPAANRGLPLRPDRSGRQEVRSAKGGRACRRKARLSPRDVRNAGSSGNVVENKGSSKNRCRKVDAVILDSLVYAKDLVLPVNLWPSSYEVMNF
jgi:hypothetical protein